MGNNVSNTVSEQKDDLKHSDSDEESDEEHNECIINPGDDRRIIICDSQNKHDGIIQCMGTIDSQYIPDSVKKQKEFCHGTGTVIHIDENNNIYVLSAAHNIRGNERECNNCTTKTLKRKCPSCGYNTNITGKLIKPKDVYFARRGITKQNLGETIARYQVDDYDLPKKYAIFKRA
eukprot:464795_1